MTHIERRDYLDEIKPDDPALQGDPAQEIGGFIVGDTSEARCPDAWRDSRIEGIGVERDVVTRSIRDAFEDRFNAYTVKLLRSDEDAAIGTRVINFLLPGAADRP
jgi:hypothetical protein